MAEWLVKREKIADVIRVEAETLAIAGDVKVALLVDGNNQPVAGYPVATLIGITRADAIKAQEKAG